MHSDPKEPVIRPFEIGASDQSQLAGALAKLGQIAVLFCRELRRAAPFLARQRARVVVGEPLADEEALALSGGPSFLVKLQGPEHVWAALHFDERAIIALVEGLFGGTTVDAEDDEALPQGSEGDAGRQVLGDTLTLAQRALLRRLCGDMSSQLKALVAAQTGKTLVVTELSSLKRAQAPELWPDAVAVDCRIEEVPHPWAIRLFMGSDALSKLCAEATGKRETVDSPSMADAALRIPVTVIAELGRVTLKLSQVLGLRVGDTLRLPSAANDPVLVRVEGVPKFDAVPVISRGQVAVKIHSRHTE